MRILHIITGLGNGGAEGALYRLTRADRRNSHHIAVMTDFGFSADRFVAQGIGVDCLAMPRGLITLRGIIMLVQLIRRTQPDIVQTWMYHADLVGGVLARLAGHRIVIWGVRASDAHQHPKGVSSKGLVWLCAKLSWLVPARIIFVSQLGSVIHRRMGYRSSTSRVIANGYDTARLTPDPDAGRRQREAWRIAPGDQLIGMVARWDPLKDHETLIAALRALDTRATIPWACALIGAEMTTDNSDLVALLNRYDVLQKVKLIGPHTDITSVMNALDVHVLSSKSEAFPNVVAEAMACATPCVATDVGDAAVIMGPTGWVVPPGDSAAMAEALRQALAEMADPASRARRKAVCRSRIVESYSIDQMVEAYNLVWDEAVREHGHR